MKKFVLFTSMTCLMLAALMLANDALNHYLVFSSDNSNPYKMYRLFCSPRAGEIPIIGSSRAEAGFAPKEISAKAFNYGLSGSSARETVVHLKAVLSRPGSGLVIVNLDPWGLGSGPFQGDYRFAAESPIVKSEPKIQIPLVDRLPGFRFYGKTRENLAQCMNNRLSATKTIDHGAILQRLSRNKAEWEYIMARCRPPKFSCDAETKAMLANILSCNTRYEVVFVVSPIAEPWQKRFSGRKELMALENWLRTFSRVRVLDFMEAPHRYELSEFMDLTHLNESGARRFSRELKECLVSLGLAPVLDCPVL